MNVEQMTPSEIKEEILKSYNTYADYVTEYIEGFISKMYSSGQTQVATEEDMTEWLNNPDTYYEELSNLMGYEYISNGDIHMLYSMVQTLPTLNYKINVFDYTVKGYEKNVALCNKLMSKVKYKQVTRDMLSQLAGRGWLVATWLGNKKQPYLYIFDNMKYVFPAYRRNGDWVCKLDLAWLNEMEEEERLLMYETLTPYVTEALFNKYKDDTSNKEVRYIELPQDRTSCVRVNTLYRNQRLGLPLGTSALLDLAHKQTLKNLEKSISNKIISNMIVLTVGNEQKPNESIPPTVKRKISSGVANVLKQKIGVSGTPVVVVPEFVKLEVPKMDGFDGLDKEKFENINSDIATDTGVSPSLTNGVGGNYATAKLNLDILYKRIGVILEGIEEVFNKLIGFCLPKNVADNFYIEFEKEPPLTRKEQLDALMTLHSEGFAVKPILDLIPHVEYEQFIEASIYEIETLKLREKIYPPSTMYTNTATSNTSSSGSQTSIEDPTNENTIDSRDNGSNEAPEAEV